MPTGAIEPDEPQTGWGATSAAAGLKNLGTGLDHLAPIAWVAPAAALLRAGPSSCFDSVQGSYRYPFGRFAFGAAMGLM